MKNFDYDLNNFFYDWKMKDFFEYRDLVITSIVLLEPLLNEELR